MFASLLKIPEKKLLLDLVRLFSIAESPLLWGGKTWEEITSDTDLSNISIQVGEREKLLIEEYERSTGLTSQDSSLTASQSGKAALTAVMGTGFLNTMITNHVAKDEDVVFNPLFEIDKMLTKDLKSLPINKMNLPASRVSSAKSVMAVLLNKGFTEKSETIKIFLFELFLVSLRGGAISDVSSELLNDVKNYFHVEDFIFNDLLVRAEALNNEVNKALAMVLE